MKQYFKVILEALLLVVLFLAVIITCVMYDRKTLINKDPYHLAKYDSLTSQVPDTTNLVFFNEIPKDSLIDDYGILTVSFQ